MHTLTVYCWGYTRGKTSNVWPVNELQRIQRERNALIVDTRYKPFSRYREWAMPQLRPVFGRDYVWIQAFGNLNYSSWTAPIELANPADGLRKLRPLVSVDRPPLLLCMCPTTFCHRTEVAKYLAANAGWTIEHLVPEHGARRQAPPSTPLLF